MVEAMKTEQEISLIANVAAAGIKSQGDSAALKAKLWTAVLYITSISGLACGVAGMSVSLLTFAGILNESRNLSLTVSGLIVGCLALLIYSAHAMDQIQAYRSEGETENEPL